MDTPTASVASIVADWAAAARGKLASGDLTPADLDQLAVQISHCPLARRQRLLYMHSVTPHVASGLVAATVHEPVEGGATQIDVNVGELPYNTVHDAVRDGWRIISFPLQMAPFDDVEVDMLGYEFVLEKWVD